MWEILTQMLSRMTLIVTIAFLITRLSIFRKMIYHRVSIGDLFFLTIIFGMFGVVGNYTALVVEPGNHTFISDLWNPTLGANNALIDTRNIGVIIGGFFAGPIVGIGASIIAGTHRLLMGGFISGHTAALKLIGVTGPPVIIIIINSIGIWMCALIFYDVKNKAFQLLIKSIIRMREKIITSFGLIFRVYQLKIPAIMNSWDFFILL